MLRNRKKIAIITSIWYSLLTNRALRSEYNALVCLASAADGVHLVRRIFATRKGLTNQVSLLLYQEIINEISYVRSEAA